MAFADKIVELYAGQVKLEYKDKSHRYFVQELTPTGSWGKQESVKGVTTILSSTLEKSGLMLWPMGLALRELTGFYDFTVETGARMTGFSKDVGTLWKADLSDKDAMLQLVLSASKAHARKKDQAADIGTAVHAAIETYVNGQTSMIGGEFSKEDVKMANKAFASFVNWWDMTKPELIVAEALVYSREFNFAGAFDGLVKIDGKLVLCDWKTSGASVSGGAPQGVYYSYFIQSALYALAWEEMGNDPIDDLMIVSCRKDGQFDTVRASELGLTMPQVKEWAIAVVRCHQMMESTKKALMNNVKEKV